MHPSLAGFPVVVTYSVQWGEQDAFGHVNNTVYFRWCESARIAYLEKVGLSSEIAGQGIGPILAHIGCNFRKPVTYPDTVHVGARVTRLGRSSFEMEHLIVSDRLEIAADAQSTLVVYDYNTAKPHPIPDQLRSAIERLEQRSL